MNEDTNNWRKLGEELIVSSLVEKGIDFIDSPNLYSIINPFLNDVKKECFNNLLNFLDIDDKENGYIIYRCRKITVKELEDIIDTM